MILSQKKNSNNLKLNGMNTTNIGSEMYQCIKDLFPLNRSLTGEPNRITLKYLKNILPNLKIGAYDSGKRVFDWTIPEEWNVSDAYVINEKGDKIIDFKVNNLHLVGYSIPVDQSFSYEELKEHLHFDQELENAIPYKTSYYNKTWGFCLTYNQFKSLSKSEKYRVKIDSKFSSGKLNFGELIIKGKSNKEVLLSTYICHPSMANNELSGIAVTVALAKYLSEQKNLFYTYRILFIPETIGSISYLSENFTEMKNNTTAGFVITCVGDDLNYSFLPSRLGNTYADKVGRFALDNYTKVYKEYSFLERGSDERQYCSPLIDLPVVSIMRSKYGTYKEYHTSADDLNFISPKGLEGAYDIYLKAIEVLELNKVFTPKTMCEPQLGKRNLYEITSDENPNSLINLIAYIDGKLDLMDLSKIINEDFFECHRVAQKLLKNDLIF